MIILPTVGNKSRPGVHGSPASPKRNFWTVLKSLGSLLSDWVYEIFAVTPTSMANLDFKKSCHENKRLKSDNLLPFLQVLFK